MILLAAEDKWTANWLHEECIDRFFTSHAGEDEFDPDCVGRTCSFCGGPDPFVSLQDFDDQKHPFHARCLTVFGMMVRDAEVN